MKNRNEKLRKEIDKLREDLTKEKEQKMKADPETYAFGFLCYKRGLLHRGQEDITEFKKRLEQKQKEVYEYKENYQVSPEDIIKELLEEFDNE